MAKKRKIRIKPICIMAFLFGTLALACIFLPGLTYESKLTQTISANINGIIGAFGGDAVVNIKAGNIIIQDKEYFQGNILIILGYVLPFLGGVLCLLSRGRKSQFMQMGAVLLFVGGFVLIMLQKELFTSVNDFNNIIVQSTITIDIAYGAILSLVFSSIGAFACVGAVATQ